MEARVAKLEAHVEHVLTALKRLDDVPTKVAVIEERVGHLPTKGWMIAWLSGALLFLTALITFSEKLHNLVG
jgi:hypothetical protein